MEWVVLPLPSPKGKALLDAVSLKRYVQQHALLEVVDAFIVHLVAVRPTDPLPSPLPSGRSPPVCCGPQHWCSRQRGCDASLQWISGWAG